MKICNKCFQRYECDDEELDIGLCIRCWTLKQVGIDENDAI